MLTGSSELDTRDQCTCSFETRPRLTSGLQHLPEIASGILFDETVTLRATDGTDNSSS